MKNLLFMCLVFMMNLSYGQDFNSHRVSVITNVLENPVFNRELYAVSLKDKYRDVITNKTSLNNYVDLLVEDAAYTHNSSYVYSGWEEAERFLLNVLKKAAPENVIDASVKIKIVRDADFNAHCREDGTLFINIGLLASLNTEAELAAILCHELGHYLFFHSYKRYQKQVNSQNASTIMGSFGLLGLAPQYAFSKSLQEQEAEADDFAIKSFKQSAYSAKGLVGSFDYMLQLEKLQRKSVNFRLPVFYLSSHPPTAERLEKMNAINGGTENPGYNFLVDSLYFKNLKRRATDETIFLSFNEANYDACLYYSFRENLQYPADEFYLFYTLESIRRVSLISENSDTRYFIAGDYDLEAPEPQMKPLHINSKIKKAKIRKSVFYNLAELYPNTFFDKSSNRLLKNDTLEFITEQEALTYFSKQAKNSCSSCFLPLKLLKEPFTIPEAAKINGSLEHSFYRTCSGYDSLQGSLPNFEKVPVFFNSIFIKQYGAAFNKISFISTSEIRKQYKEFGIDRTGLKPLVFYNPMSLPEQYNLYGIMTVIENWYKIRTGVNPEKGGLKNIKEHHYDIVSFPVTTVFPELAAFAHKYQFKKLMFFDMALYSQVQQNFGGATETQSHIGTIYCINFEKNTISCGKTAMSGGAPASVRSLIAGFESVFLEQSRR